MGRVLSAGFLLLGFKHLADPIASIVDQPPRDGSVNVDVTSANIQKTVSGSVSDLSAGTMVVVTGQRNSDGSVTADNVEIRPATPWTGRGED